MCVLYFCTLSVCLLMALMKHGHNLFTMLTVGHLAGMNKGFFHTHMSLQSRFINKPWPYSAQVGCSDC